VQQLAEDLQQVRPTLMIAVPRVFERFYGRIQQQIAEGSAVKRWLFRATESVGSRRFEHGQGRGNWSPALLLWPLLSHLVAAKVLGRLGGRLRLAVSGGAALSGPVGRLFVGLGLPLLQGYGLTETSPVISVNTPENNDPASVGPPLPGLEWRLSEEGELQVRSPWVMMGYWNNPEATAQVLEKDGWLHTGDKVAFRDGRFYITGRLKEILVLSNGENVPPGDLESAILLDGLFEQAMVVGEGRPFLSAVLVLSRERWQGFARDLGVDPERPESLTDSRVVGAVTGRVASQLREFPGYARVRRVVLSLDPWTVDNGLLTPTMKLRRARVLEAHGDAVEALYETGPTAARRRRPG
jgi:long-chain acyl-CoA synthetase